MGDGCVIVGRQMRKRELFAILISTSMWTSASAATFEPKVADVCTKSSHNPKIYLLDPRRLVGQLVEKVAGVSAIDLDASGNGVLFPENAKALLDPQGFCKGGKCSTQTQTALGTAFISLKSFVDRHGSIAKSPGDIDTRSLNKDDSALRRFLLGLPSAENICLLAPPSPLVAGPSAEKPGSSTKPLLADVPHYFALRQNVEDLAIPQSDPSFKGLKQASISWTDDMFARKSSFALDLAAGYTFGRFSLDEDGHFLGQVTPFITYDQQFVQTSNPTQNSRAQNIGVGVVGDVTFPTGFGGYQNVQFYPKYVESVSSRAKVLSGNFVYTPMYGIPGIDNVYYLVPDLLSFLITPRLKVVVNDVVTPGTNTALLKQGSYYWFGPQLQFALFGEGIFDGFTYNLSYEKYDVVRGLIPNVYLFQTSLNYDFGKSKLISVQLSYKKGRNLDTLENINQVTLGLGAKY
jgi:hypothetical protein